MSKRNSSKRNPLKELENTLERTKYASNIQIFEGKFHDDSRKDELPRISYDIQTNPKKESQLQKLEKKIRGGFYDGHYPDCEITTCIKQISEEQETHTLNVSFNKPFNKVDRAKKTLRMAVHLKKIIKKYHLENNH